MGRHTSGAAGSGSGRIGDDEATPASASNRGKTQSSLGATGRRRLLVADDDDDGELVSVGDCRKHMGSETDHTGIQRSSQKASTLGATLKYGFTKLRHFTPMYAVHGHQSHFRTAGSYLSSRICRCRTMTILCCIPERTTMWNKYGVGRRG
jgi:hypothetical protein